MRNFFTLALLLVLLSLFMAGCDSGPHTTQKKHLRFADFEADTFITYMKGADAVPTTTSLDFQFKPTRVGAYTIVFSNGNSEIVISTNTDDPVNKKYVVDGVGKSGDKAGTVVTVVFSDGKSMEKTVVNVD